jgi:hypothetical protein
MSRQRKWRESHVPKSRCVECGYKMDMASCVNGGTPRSGCFSLCIRCGSLAVFDDTLRLRKPTLDEYVISMLMPDLQEMRAAILAMPKEKK